MHTNQQSLSTLKVVENCQHSTPANTLVRFNFESTSVRIYEQDDHPWFCYADVEKALDYRERSDFHRSEWCDKEGVGKFTTPTESGLQEMIYISERNLYAMVARSNKPEAKRLMDWVYRDVLPSLRKTGTYTVGQEMRQADGQDPILAALQTIMDIRRSQIHLETRTTGIEHRLDEVEKELNVRKSAALALPPPEGPDVTFTVRERCRLAIDRLVSLSGLSHGHCWREMYRRYEVSTGKSLYNATIGKEGAHDQAKFDSKLEYIDKKGDIRVLYKLIHQAIDKAARGDLSLC